MAFRTMTMSSYDFDQTSEHWHLFRKLSLLFLLIVAIALGLVILFRQKTGIPLLWFNLLADAGLGLIAGAGSRILLRQRNGFIRGLASAAMAIIGLVVLGYFTDWKSGIGPLQFVGRNAANWNRLTHAVSSLDWNNTIRYLRIDRFDVNWFALAHMMIAIDSSWIALRAWNHSSPRVLEPSVSSPRVRSRRRAARTSPSLAVVPHVPAAQRVSVPGSNSRSRVKRRKPERVRSSGSSRSKAWNPLRRKPDVQLAVYEEHRCPYCLEPVKRNDPRGTVECDICHTLHHKDCWDITGSCQVPHLN
ncbi:MAG: hypothetical protein HY258_09415 [Chloroflexi bacterium]|nr:hypothetical protein [Chloroflexota bacterium]